jgi:hypothetical protein
MTLRKGWAAVVAVAGLLGGCSSDVRPNAATGDGGGIVLTNPDIGTIMLSDTGVTPDLTLITDVQIVDNGPRPDVAPVDRPVTGNDASADGGRDGGATDTGAVTDTGVTRTPRAFCGFSPTELAALAVRTATCLNMAPQEVVAQMFRPSYWESGLITSRPCSILRAALANNGGCTGFLLDSLKIGVEPAPGGVCASPVVGCREPAPGFQTATTCRNGLLISEECQYVTGTSECVSSATAVGCRPQPTQTGSCSGGPRCLEGRLQRCVGGAYVFSLDCDPSATTCDATADACVGTGAACTGDTDRCEGTSIQQCRGGRLNANNCGFLATGTSCRSVSGHAFCGTGADCDPTTAPPGGTCSGNVLSLCVGGVTRDVNCVTAGFTGCGVGGCTH